MIPVNVKIQMVVHHRQNLVAVMELVSCSTRDLKSNSSFEGNDTAILTCHGKTVSIRPFVSRYSAARHESSLCNQHFAFDVFPTANVNGEAPTSSGAAGSPRLSLYLALNHLLSRLEPSIALLIRGVS